MTALYDSYDDAMRNANDFMRSVWYRWAWGLLALIFVAALIYVGYRRRVKWAKLNARLEALKQQRDEAKMRAAAEEREAAAKVHRKKAARIDAQVEKLDHQAHEAKLDYKEHIHRIDRAKRWEEIRREYEALDD